MVEKNINYINLNPLRKSLDHDKKKKKNHRAYVPQYLLIKLRENNFLDTRMLFKTTAFRALGTDVTCTL